MIQKDAAESQGVSVQIATVVPVELFYEETVAEARVSLSEADKLSGLCLSESTTSQQIIESIKECSLSEFQAWQLGEILTAEEIKKLIVELGVSLHSLDPVGGEKLLALQRRGEGVGTCAVVVLICRFKLKPEFCEEQDFTIEDKYLEIGKELRLLRKAINDTQYKFGNGSQSVFSDLFAILQEKSDVAVDLLDPDYAFSFISVNHSGDDFQDGLFDSLASSTLSEPEKPLRMPCAEEDRGVWGLHCDWSTLLQTSKFESTELVAKEFNRLLAMELVLQTYWNRCAKFAKLMDSELRSEVKLPNKDEFYLELHRTPDNANHLISSMASHSNVKMLNKLFETSRVEYETDKFKGMRESLLARDARKLSKEQHNSQVRTEALSIMVLLVAVGSIVIAAIEGLREFDGFSIISFFIAISLFLLVWRFMDFILNPHKAEKGLMPARWFRKIRRRK